MKSINTFTFNRSVFAGILVAIFTVGTSGLMAQSGTPLTKQQREVIIDAILSGNLNAIRNLARREPKIAPAVAALYAKHSGAKGTDAGKIAASIASSVDANIEECSEITVAVSQGTTASLEEVGDIIAEVSQAMTDTFGKIENYAAYTAKVAKGLGLRGKEAGKFAAIVVEVTGI